MHGYQSKVSKVSNSEHREGWLFNKMSAQQNHLKESRGFQPQGGYG